MIPSPPSLPSPTSPTSRETQRRFSFADLGSCRPLLNVNAVMALLDLDEDAVLYLIEDGQLPFAFDIADRDAKARELRIWKGCLAAMPVSGPPSPRPSPQGEGALARVIGRILPRTNAATLRVEPDLARAFNCSATHVNDLIAQRELQEVVNPERKATQTRIVTRESVVLFLERRRIV